MLLTLVCSSYQLLYSSAWSGSFFLFSSSLVEFSWCFSIFFLVQLTLSLLILMNLYLVNYLSFSLVSGLLSVFQWRSVLLSSHFSQFSSAVQSCPMLCNSMTAACQASLSITNSRSLFRLMSFESGMTSNHLILCHPILLLPAIGQG